ncbi:MAG TPA: thioredoxin domain-containing protein [Micromonosporaceae bacterium]
MSKRAGQKQAARVVREQLAAERRRQRARLITLLAVALLVIGGLVGWGVWQSQRPKGDIALPAGVNDVGGDRAGIDVAGDGPVTVEVYLDYICPACRQFEATANPTINQLILDKKIKLVWHPLGFLDDKSTTNYSTRAASAASCAADEGKLKEYGEALFAQQPAEGTAGLSDDQLIELGGPIGLNAPSFAQCVRAEKYQDWIGLVNERAAQRGVNATPTVYVDGKLLENPTAENLKAAVDAAG